MPQSPVVPVTVGLSHYSYFGSTSDYPFFSCYPFLAYITMLMGEIIPVSPHVKF
jgi:hypothetical protein